MNYLPQNAFSNDYGSFLKTPPTLIIPFKHQSNAVLSSYSCFCPAIWLAVTVSFYFELLEYREWSMCKIRTSYFHSRVGYDFEFVSLMRILYWFELMFYLYFEYYFESTIFNFILSNFQNFIIIFWSNGNIFLKFAKDIGLWKKLTSLGIEPANRKKKVLKPSALNHSSTMTFRHPGFRWKNKSDFILKSHGLQRVVSIGKLTNQNLQAVRLGYSVMTWIHFISMSWVHVRLIK